VRHPLYATWAMVYHMETVSRMLLAPYLEPHEEAVGGGVLVKHLRPAARRRSAARDGAAGARARRPRLHARGGPQPRP